MKKLLAQLAEVMRDPQMLEIAFVETKQHRKVLARLYWFDEVVEADDRPEVDSTHAAWDPAGDDDDDRWN